MRSSPFFSALMICLVCGFARADEKPDPIADNGEQTKEPQTPDHLIPINPYSFWRMPYTKQLTEHLGLGEAYFARMTVRPSFVAEYSIRVHGGPKDYTVESSKEFFVTYTTSDQNIWGSMPENNSENIQKTVTPKSFTASIPAETARRVCALWDEMILKTRYARDWGGGMDGTTIEFSSVQGHGETWSPTVGSPPALLHDLGERLIDYSKAPAEERMKLLDAIHTSAAKLENQMKR